MLKHADVREMIIIMISLLLFVTKEEQNFNFRKKEGQERKVIDFSWNAACGSRVIIIYLLLVLFTFSNDHHLL